MNSSKKALFVAVMAMFAMSLASQSLALAETPAVGTPVKAEHKARVKKSVSKKEHKKNEKGAVAAPSVATKTS